MSDNKNLGDEFNEMLGDAKEGVKKAADKTEEFAKDFANDTKEAFNEVSANGKNVAIIAHITLIGWVIALVMNNSNKTEIGSFYIRQMLGLMILSLLLYFIPFVGWILNLVLLVFWILSLIGALNGEKKLTPGIGAYFQDWFKSL